MRVLIIGDGPAGLSAALFLAKNGAEVDVFAANDTPMHYAMLYNYLGLPEITGTAFQETARAQVTGFGARLHGTAALATEATDAGFRVDTAEASFTGDYLIIAEGKGAKLAQSLGLEKTDRGVPVATHGRTAMDRLYVVGRATVPQRSQAIIAAGQGAEAALDILAREKGKDFVDYDSVD